MSESPRQPAPGSRIAPSCLSYWQVVGGRKAEARNGAALLWQGIASDARAAALADPCGLPIPAYGRILVRLQDSRRDHRRAKGLALRYAGLMGRHLDAPSPVQQAANGNVAKCRLPILTSEAEELRVAWSRLLRRGECSILADTRGQIRLGAERRLAGMLARSRQLELFAPRPTAEALLRSIAASFLGQDEASLG